MYISLYRKYRPAKFEEMFGQEHIKTVLKRQCETGKVSHAYLFCGTRGTGKTTSAKILAKAVNCLEPENGEPCGKCASCVSIDNGTSTDVLELDAASNNGVDDIRDICEQVVYPPASQKFRVYIIDEVHMLTSGAYNALLKTLEEPPEHVIFILATTELQKIPPTILSRCQRFEFRRITPEDICACLLFVAKNEGITLEKPAAELLSILADGSMRDSLSLLESCVTAGNGSAITEETVSRQLGLAEDGMITSILGAVINGNAASALELLDKYYNSAKSLPLLMEDLVSAIRDILVFSQPSVKLTSVSHLSAEQIKSFSQKAPASRLLYMAEVLEDIQTRLIRYPFNKRMLCEMALIKLCNSKLSTSPDALSARIAALEAGAYSAEPRQKESVAMPTPEKPKKEQSAPDLPKKQTHEVEKTSKPELYDKMPQLVDSLKASGSQCYVISQAKLMVDGNKFIIATSPFMMGMLNDEKSVAQLKKALKNLDGIDYDIVFVDEAETKSTGGGFIDEL